jgi:superfamily II DNA or RNA helicase
VIDEAHHAVAQTYIDILQELGAFDDANVFPFVLGVTATADLPEEGDPDADE